MRNKLEDLNNHLFAQLERLGDETMDGDKVRKEIERGKAISSVASQIIASGNLALQAAKLMDNREDANTSLPKLLVTKNE